MKYKSHAEVPVLYVDNTRRGYSSASAGPIKMETDHFLTENMWDCRSSKDLIYLHIYTYILNNFRVYTCQVVRG